PVPEGSAVGAGREVFAAAPGDVRKMARRQSLGRKTRVVERVGYAGRDALRRGPDGHVGWVGMCFRCAVPTPGRFPTRSSPEGSASASKLDVQCHAQGARVALVEEEAAAVDRGVVVLVARVEQVHAQRGMLVE